MSLVKPNLSFSKDFQGILRQHPHCALELSQLKSSSVRFIKRQFLAGKYLPCKTYTLKMFWTSIWNSVVHAVVVYNSALSYLPIHAVYTSVHTSSLPTVGKTMNEPSETPRLIFMVQIKFLIFELYSVLPHRNSSK